MYKSFQFGILILTSTLTVTFIILSTHIFINGPNWKTLFKAALDERLESVLQNTCKEIPGNAVRKEFRSMHYFKHNIPPKSMRNEECVQAFQRNRDATYTILEEQICRHRFIFVTGMHFSGTSTLNYILQFHGLASGHSDTGAPEDEGMWLQNEYPQDFSFGGPCLFELRGDAFLRATSANDHKRQCIFSQWAKYWENMTVPLLIEKSPPTIIQLGFREALFPGVSSNVIAVRHPLYPCFWKFVKNLDWRQGSKEMIGIQQKLTMALEAWLQTHEFLIDTSLKGLKKSTQTAIFMVEDFFYKKDAIDTILNIPEIFFPELKVNYPKKLKTQDMHRRRLEFRGEGNNAIKEFNPARIKSWMIEWDEKMIEKDLLSTWNLLGILKSYENRVNKFGYSLLHVSRIDPYAFHEAFSLNENHIFQES